MARIENCLWLKSWVAEDGLTIGAVSVTPCEFDDYSSRIYDTADTEWEGDESLAENWDNPDYEAVYRGDNGYEWYYDVVYHDGVAHAGDTLDPFDEYDPLFHVG